MGLGFEFLRHVERTRVLLHLVDMSGMTEEDPFTNFRQINEELKKYNPELLERRQIIVPTKMDLPGSDEELKKFEKQVRADERYADFEIFPISSITHNGLEKLVARTADVLEEIPQHSLIATSDEETEKTYEFSSEKDFTIENIDDVWVIEGEKIEKLFKMTDTTHDESLLRFARQMRGMGIDDELRRLGARNGDSVQILDFVFEFVE